MNNNKRTISKTARIHRWFIRAASITLCLSMGLTVASCGKGKTDPVKTISEDTAYFSVQNLAYYEASEGEDSSLVSAVFCKDQIAMLITVNNYGIMGSTPEMDLKIQMEKEASSTVSAEDGDMVITDEIIDPGIFPEPTIKYIVLFYDNQGNLVSQADLSSAFDSNTYVMNMTCDSEGNIVLLTQGFDPDTYESKLMLYSFDTSGKQLGEPEWLPFVANISVNQMATDKEGNMYFTGYGEKGATINVIDSKGKPLFDISEGTENINGFMYLIGDTMYVDGYQTNEKEYKYVFYPVDTAAKKLGEPIDLTSFSSMGGTGFFAGSEGLYYSDTIGVYTIDLETGEKNAILLWKDTDVENNMNGGQRVIVLSSDKVMIMSTTYTQQGAQTKVSLLTREAQNPNVGKKIITIAGVGITYNADVLSSVYNFNTASSEYRIEIHDYMENQVINSEDDYAKVINTMNMEILSGDGPDIIFGSFQSFSNFEAKGLLVDLYTLMEKDSAFRKEDYLPSIFKVCESDGKLYQMGTSFTIQGLAGAKSVVGDRMGWTVDEFNAMVNTLPDKMVPLANQTQTSLLTSSLYASMDAFVDNFKGEVNFDSPEFYQLLDYAKTYGTDDDILDGGEYVDEQTMLQNGELALIACYISDPTGYGQYETLVGEPVSILGFPSSDKRGPMCYMNTMLAISSESGSPQASWDFVKTFLSEDAQEKIAENYQIPVLMSAFESQIENALNPDEYSGGPIIFDKMGQMVPMTQDMVQSYRNLINGLDTLASYDQEIVNIIFEEVPAYFNGQKSEQDVAGLIQNRVQTLVSERQ